MKIASFTVDHNKLERGIYVSRRDGEVTTFDLRMRRPYAEPVLTETETHSLEHLLAVALRNGDAGGNVLYVGPMGCATGFYALFKNMTDEAALWNVTRAFKEILVLKEMPGNSKDECGNCFTLDLSAGKRIAEEYLKTLEGKSSPDKYK